MTQSISDGEFAAFLAEQHRDTARFYIEQAKKHLSYARQFEQQAKEGRFDLSAIK